MKKLTQNSSPEFDRIVYSVVGRLRQQGVTSIKANCSGFVQPGVIRWDENDEGIVPDIVAEHDGATHVFEIETRGNLDPNTVEDRWRLLSVFARRSKGKFYLIIPEQKEDHLQRIVNDLSLRPEILKLQGIA